MKVKLVAHSVPTEGSDPRKLVVLAVKTSQGALNSKDASHYLASYSEESARKWLLKSVEFPSVLEHVTFTFLIEDISRVCSHQLVRHRIASYTQESMRYSEGYVTRCVESAREVLAKMFNINVLASPTSVLEAFIALASEADLVSVASQCFVIPDELDAAKAVAFAKSVLSSLLLYYDMISDGVPKEIARYILPQALKTRILVTMNLRELLHIACLRLSPKTQSETREVVKKMIEEAKKVVPEIEQLLENFCASER